MDEYMFSEVDSLLLDDAVDEWIDAEIDSMMDEGAGIAYMLDNEIDPIVEEGYVNEEMQLNTNTMSQIIGDKRITVSISIEDLKELLNPTPEELPAKSEDEDDFVMYEDDDDDLDTDVPETSISDTEYESPNNDKDAEELSKKEEKEDKKEDTSDKKDDEDKKSEEDKK